MNHSKTLDFKRELCQMLGRKRHELHTYRKGKDMVIYWNAGYKLPHVLELFVTEVLLGKWHR